MKTLNNTMAYFCDILLFHFGCPDRLPFSYSSEGIMWRGVDDVLTGLTL